MSNGNVLVVPRPFVTEVGSAVARRRKSAADGAQAVIGVQRQPSIDIREVSRRGWDHATQHATQLQLRAGDVVYVALAVDLGLPLLSWDQELLTRASAVVDARTPDQIPT